MNNLLMRGSILVVFFLSLIVSAAPAIQADSATEINFQGILEDSGGNPLTGTYNLRFSIYNQSSGVVWPLDGTAEEHLQVSVDNGLFSVELGSQGKPVSPTCFDGSDRYLQIEVCVNADPSCSTYEALSPQQKMSSVVYASCATAFKPGLQMTGNDTQLTLTTTGTTGTAMSGIASATTGTAAAIYGQSFSDSGAGVAGYSTDAGYGVYGSSPNGFAIYANGNAHVNGELSTSPKTSYLRVHASDFQKMGDSSVVIEINSVFLSLPAIPAEVASIAIDLPHGATITNLTASFYDNSLMHYGELRLVSIDNYGVFTDIATVQTMGQSLMPEIVSVDVTGSNAIVNNQDKELNLLLTIARETEISQVAFRSARIEYTYTSP